MESYTLLFKCTTERTLAVPIHAEDYDDATERAMAMLSASQGNPEILAQHVRERWVAASTYVELERIE
jgi:hypothetical protein